MGGDQLRLQRRQLSMIGSLSPPIGEQLRRGRRLSGRWVRVRISSGAARQRRSPALGRFSAPSAAAPPRQSRSRLRYSPWGPSILQRVPREFTRNLHARMVRAPAAHEDFPLCAFRFVFFARSWRKETNHPIFSVPGTLFITDRSDRFRSESRPRSRISALV